MNSSDLPIHVLRGPAEAEAALQWLGCSGHDVRNLSLFGRGLHSEALPLGPCHAGDRIWSWGPMGGFWEEVWGRLVSPAVHHVPGLGLIAMAGPLVPLLSRSLGGTGRIPGLTAWGTLLCQAGLPRKRVASWEADLAGGRYLLMVHEPRQGVAHARRVLGNLGAGASA